MFLSPLPGEGPSPKRVIESYAEQYTIMRVITKVCGEAVFHSEPHFRNIPIIMSLDHLGKLLYPRLQRWERRRKINQIFLALVGVVALAAAIIWVSFSHAKIGK